MPVDITIRFYEELNDFIPHQHRKRDIRHSLLTPTRARDLISSFGVPPTEVDLILVNGRSAGLEHPIRSGDRVSVYPVFESLDISPVTRLRHGPLRRARFILDVHLGKLARLLRMYGFDSLYRNDYKDPDIIRIAKEEQRIILTRDVGILKNKQVSRGYFVRSQQPREQVLEVLHRFDLREKVNPLSRCMACNGMITTVRKESIAHLLQPRTRECYDVFFRCEGCSRIYWEGSHYDRMMERFRNEAGNRDRESQSDR